MELLVQMFQLAHKLPVSFHTHLTESSTILVVADISFVTLIPAKLKNAMETIVPTIAAISIGLLPAKI